MKTILKFCILLFMISCSKGDISSQNESTGYNMLLIGNSFFKPYADHLNNLAFEANLIEHSSVIVKRGGELGRPINFWNDSNTEEHQLIKSTLDQGNIEVFGMTSGYDIDSENPTEGHSAWIQYALNSIQKIIQNYLFPTNSIQNSIQNFEISWIQFNKIFIQFDNVGIDHGYKDRANKL